MIPFADSEDLVMSSGLRAATLIAVGSDHRLADPASLKCLLQECGIV